MSRCPSPLPAEPARLLRPDIVRLTGGFLILTPALNFIRFLVASHKRLNGQQA